MRPGEVSPEIVRDVIASDPATVVQVASSVECSSLYTTAVDTATPVHDRENAPVLVRSGPVIGPGLGGMSRTVTVTVSVSESGDEPVVSVTVSVNVNTVSAEGAVNAGLD